MFVYICTHEYMCVCGVNTNMVTFSFQYTAVIESNDTTTPAGHSQVFSCSRVLVHVLEPFVLESISCSHDVL